MEQGKSERARREEEILAEWDKNQIFEKTLEKPSPKGDFVFFEGPPTANAKPGIHHLEARAFKDVIPRYKTMRGYHVRRKAGWDTHGLPVEIAVEKELGLKNKKEIEEYGVAAFNRKCKESVWKYVKEWEQFTKRIAFWIDQDDPYVTYDPNYMESLWWIIARTWKKGLIYKDYKVVPWCPRCGTGLSSHELAQGYEDVEDASVYVKFKVKSGHNVIYQTILKSGNSDNTNVSTELIDTSTADVYLLAWTTTPWTLPGNVALAVGKHFRYVVAKSKKSNEVIILAESRFPILEDDYEILGITEGQNFAGRHGDDKRLEYEPLYSYLKDSLPKEEQKNLKNAYKVYTADFVSTEDGSGIVHTAVMYGQDDFEFGTGIGLPKHHLVNEEGKFTDDVKDFAGEFVKDADNKIIEDLKKRNLLLKEEQITHTYPFCWRCKTPLIYYARDSWYIAMSTLRDKLIKENKRIHWEPGHIQEGRFGEWLRELKDWAISRNRYWGTPLPIWECEKCDKREVAESIEDLKKKTKKSGNRYFVMRHAHAHKNSTGEIGISNEDKNHLTEDGKKEALAVAKRLKKEDADIVIHSPLLRTKETAEILAKELGLKGGQLIEDKRLREFDPGSKYHGKTWIKYFNDFPSRSDQYAKRADDGESRLDIKRRVGELLYELESKYKDKSILLVTHDAVADSIHMAAVGSNDYTTRDDFGDLNTAEIREIDFTPTPHNDDYEIDLHRPYVDDVELLCPCGATMKRIPEVMDVWFDSGAMPFAQDHYPFENKRFMHKHYPADFISEAIDQTRGWFYTLHAIGMLVRKKRAFNNVICLGHILDKKGKKMSKSIGNVVDPNTMLDTYGADALRLWMYGVNQPGEAKNFDERGVDEIIKRTLQILDNVVKFYELYKEEEADTSRVGGHVLDAWIVAKLHELLSITTESLDSYKVLEPARAFRVFVTDLSTWYIRRSRDRFKSDDEEDRKAALATTRHVLLTLSKIIAPMAPFVSEDIYKRIGGNLESVHLEEWPKREKVDKKIISEMDEVRETVSRALESRTQEGIKVRQPLSRLVIRKHESAIHDNYELKKLIADEVNVKEVVFEEGTGWDIELDTELTDELKKEGELRELVRAIQSMRKKHNLAPGEPVTLSVQTDETGKKFVEEFRNEIQRSTSTESIIFDSSEGGEEIKTDSYNFVIGLKK